jgi:predicted metal-binding membrane protein
MAGGTLLERALSSDRVIVITILVAVTFGSWLFLLGGAGSGMSMLGMTGLDLAAGGGMRMALQMEPWSPAYAVVMFCMWWVMMIAMMLPSASPTVLLFARIHHKQRERGEAYVPASVFILGYLAVWGGFSLIATAGQWALESIGLLNPMMVSTVPWLGGGLLIVAGLWQFSPWKQACLNHCRSPLSFLMTRWRQGWKGAFVMGLDHGAFCLGCCWFLMALLFFGGIMNLWWIGGLALYVLLEKTVPAGHWLGYGLGVVLTAWGTWMLASALS